MSAEEKAGAILFFGQAGCVGCHKVSGQSNEMFSDFTNRVIGVPQVAPYFGAGKGNVVFDGPGRDEDFGNEQVTGNPADRYRFRTSPLRNVAMEPAFFHNGAFTRLEDAIRHHLDALDSARHYSAFRAGVDQDLTFRLGPIEPVLARIDPLMTQPVRLTRDEFEALVKFVRDSLLDPRALPHNLCKLVPEAVPSGMRWLASSSAESKTISDAVFELQHPMERHVMDELPGLKQHSALRVLHTGFYEVPFGATDSKRCSGGVLNHG